MTAFRLEMFEDFFLKKERYGKWRWCEHDWLIFLHLLLAMEVWLMKETQRSAFWKKISYFNGKALKENLKEVLDGGRKEDIKEVDSCLAL